MPTGITWLIDDELLIENAPGHTPGQVAFLDTRDRTLYCADTYSTLGGVATGVFADAHEAVSACVRARETVEPNQAWARRYGEGYARFRALYPAIRGVEELAWE